MFICVANKHLSFFKFANSVRKTSAVTETYKKKLYLFEKIKYFEQKSLVS